MREKILLLSLIMLGIALTSCAGSSASSSSNAVLENMSMANEVNDINEDIYACLPEGVSLDDTQRVKELLPDADGYVSYDNMGVRFLLPEGFRAYAYECPENAGFDTVNHSCEGAIFLVNPYFPESKEFIRISLFTSLSCYVQDFDEYKERGGGADTITKFYDTLKANLKQNAVVFEKHETIDGYDYIGEENDPSAEILPYGSGNDNNSNFKDVLQFNYSSAIWRTPTPDSSVGERAIEPFELSNGGFGLNIKYDLTRNGIAMRKDVYWTYKPGEKLFRRIEFSRDKNAASLTEPEGFMESLEIYSPIYDEKTLQSRTIEQWFDRSGLMISEEG